MSDKLPKGILVAFYGDDFTGSSAVMEVLTFAGLPAVLFLEPPTAEDLDRFAGYRAIGIAGVARSQGPEWMDRELPAIVSALAGLDAPIVHYKTCSTLDSSPRIGSIGRAIDIARPIVQSPAGAAKWTPLVVAAPPIGRYQAFGHLFATYDGSIHRLDRHPVMQRHPTTPMDESDVAVHIGRQTAYPIGLVDLAAIKAGRGGQVLESEISAGRTIVSLDVLDDETLTWAGRQIWERRSNGLLAVGSQGVEYALVAHWRATGLLDADAGSHSAGSVDQIIAASGSVSPGTASQIAWAVDHGFEVVAIQPEAVLEDGEWCAEVQRAADAAHQALSQGRSVVIATARGPDDPSITHLRNAVAASGRPPEEVNARVAEGLGDAILRLVERTGIRRVAIAGGDTSGFAARKLGIKALTALAPLAGGAPLCRAFSHSAAVDGLEIVLKGGQMGGVDFFGQVRAGRATELRE